MSYVHKKTKLSFKNKGAQQEKNKNKKEKENTQRPTETQKAKGLASPSLLLGFARAEMKTWYQ